VKCEGRYFTIIGAGPFPTYSALSQFYAQKLALCQHFKFMGCPLGAAPFDDSEPLVFVHQDLSMRNIMLGSDGHVWLIDWEYAEFYPRWFEYASMMAYKGIYPSSWTSVIPSIAGNYESQTQFLDNISWALFHPRLRL
jgi:thiamine kinase-like enzyme